MFQMLASYPANALPALEPCGMCPDSLDPIKWHTTQAQRSIKATRRNHVWSYDFIFDQTSDGRRLKWLPLVDEFTKENLALEVDRRLESDDVIALPTARIGSF